MIRVKLVSCVLIAITIVRYVQVVVPSFWGQDRVPIVSVMVQDCFYEGFQVVRVGLGADEGAIQSHIDLFEERVDQVVG